MKVVTELKIDTNDLHPLVSEIHKYRTMSENSADLQIQLNYIKTEVIGLIQEGFLLGEKCCE